MKRILSILAAIILIFCIGSPFVLANDEKVMNETFKADKKLELDLVLGDCKIDKSSDKKIHLSVRYTYNDDEFNIEISDRSRSVSIEEELSNNPDGYSNWFLSVPDGVEIEFSSATGGLTVEKVDIELEASSGTGSMELNGVKGEYEVSSGTGRIEVSKSTGEFELSSGTGKVEVENSEGSFEASSGTGRVYAEDVTLNDDSDFSSGTGRVEVKSPVCQDYDVSISSGTGSATLDLDGKALKGYFEMSSGQRSGRIICPVKFDGEEISDDGNSDKIRKWFTKGSDYPRYFISTGTGKAVLKR